MKTRTLAGKNENQLVTAMIVDKMFLATIASKWKAPGLFKSKWANIVAGWCIKHFNRYTNAPLKAIQHHFDVWAARHKDEETIKTVEQFLASLSQAYEELERESNTKLMLDLADTYFNNIALQQLSQDMNDKIEAGEGKDAQQMILSYKNISIGTSRGIDVFQDKEAIKAVFEEKAESVLSYPGELGKFLNGVMRRDSFVSFLAPEKRGKSWWLMDAAFRAMTQRRKVAYFEAGDNSQNQNMTRLMIRTTGISDRYTTYKYPVAITRGPQAAAMPVFETRDRKGHLDFKTCWERCEQLKKRKIKSDSSYYKLSCHPNSTLCVKDIDSILNEWQQETGWTPDVIVIDYADILNMAVYGVEGRDRINETWKMLRGLSQQWHCLVLTATQANAEGGRISRLGRGNFSDDKRKLAHVTAMIGINQTTEEKENQLMRLNFIGVREGEYLETKCVHIVGCLRIGRPWILSCK